MQGLFDEVRDEAAEPYPLLLFGRAELRRRCFTPMMPSDSDCRTVPRTGAVRAQLSSRDTVIARAVCLPHGWRHNGDGNWQHANATGALTASGAGALEPLAVMSILNGVRVKVSALD